jgi:two-component system OmpR family sensor kinase
MVALALVFISVASRVFLNAYLVDRADAQLYSFASSVNTPQFRSSDKVYWPTEYIVGYRSPDGQWLYVAWDRYTNPDLPNVDTSPEALQAHLNKPFTAVATDGKFRWRLLVTEAGDETYIVGQNLLNDENALDRLVFVEILVGVAVLIVLALAGAWLVRVSLRPLAAIERTAAAIASGDLTQRVPELDPRTELGQLSAALNVMLTQIESSFRARQESEDRALHSEERMRQFVADASHELRTPLTTIRGFAELYRQGAAPDPADMLRRIEEEAARMGLLVEDLLLLARLDRERPLKLAPVQLADLINDAAAAAHVVDPERTVTVEIDQPDEPLLVSGDEARLRQVIGNLVTNALTHTPPATPIAVRLYADADDAVIEVVDRGPGLTPEQSDRVFERFYRVDKARARGAATYRDGALASPHSGAGLGLAIVAALVAAHGGSVEVDSRPGEGATFRVRLPLTRQNQQAQDQNFTG